MDGNRGVEKNYFTRRIEMADKKGIQANRFIHIHPAKFSKHTIRVRATTLKTVLTLCVHKIPILDDTELNLMAVNQQRSSYLQLSPIKSLDDENSGILKLWQLFVNAGALAQP
nr:hypothetical protein [Draconibacterium orientale]